MLRILIFLFVVLLFNQYGLAQNKTITGFVTDEAHKPVSDVSVHVLNTNRFVFSKNDGSFSLPTSLSNTYTLLFEATGFASAQKEIEINNADSVITIQLQSATRQLDAVTVTAEKREDNLQQLPASVSAFTSKQVADYRLWNSNGLTAIVPSLYTDNPGDGRNITSIRGIVTTSYDPAVATYIDGVNQFSLDTYIATLTDVERIEVLRGPQGTLYGRNAMGGVINIITKQPANKTDGFAEVNLGNYGLQRYNAGFRTALIKDKLFAGASFLYTKRNGYYTNDFYNKSFDKQHLFYGNYYLKYLPAERWMITANVKHQANRNEGAFPLVNGVEDAFANPYQVSQNAVAKMIDNTFNSSLVINHAGSAVNLTAISSYQNNYRIYNAPLDADFSPLDIVTIINDYGKKYNNVKVFTQEIRAASNNEKKKLQYTAGAYFFYQKNPGRQATHYGIDSEIYHVPDINFSTISTSAAKGSGIALYGQLQYSITPKLKLVAGLRYDDEHRSLTVRSEYEKDGEEAFVILPDTSASTTFHAVSPKVNFQYLISANSNVYAGYSRGYRVGGLSPLPADPSGPVVLSSYSPENSDNYEIGSKNRWLHDKLQVNITAFAAFINNAQVPTLVLPDAITIIKNTGKLQTRGIEAEIAATPVKGLQVDYNVGIVHTEYKSLKISANGSEINLDGKKQIYTPAATSMLAAQYNFLINKTTKLLIRSEWQYRGRLYFDFANTIQQSDYSLLHARAGAELKHFGLYVWCRNVLNKKYIAYAYDFGAVHLGDPRTFGVTLSTRW